MQPLKICIGPTIRIGPESWCLPYVGFLEKEMEEDWRKTPKHYLSLDS